MWVGEEKSQTPPTGRMLPGDWLDGQGRQRERINPCKDVDVQESSQLGTLGRSMGTSLECMGRGKRVLEGPTEDGIPGKFTAVQLLLSCKLLQPVAPSTRTYLDVSLSISNKSMPQLKSIQ